MTLFYISYATDDGFLGATVVEADNDAHAASVAARRGLDPGGEAAVLRIPEGLDSDEMAEALSYKDRLVTREELMSNGADRLGDLPGEVQDAVDDHASVFK